MAVSVIGVTVIQLSDVFSAYPLYALPSLPGGVSIGDTVLVGIVGPTRTTSDFGTGWTILGGTDTWQYATWDGTQTMPTFVAEGPWPSWVVCAAFTGDPLSYFVYNHTAIGLGDWSQTDPASPPDTPAACVAFIAGGHSVYEDGGEFDQVGCTRDNCLEPPESGVDDWISRDCFEAFADGGTELAAGFVTPSGIVGAPLGPRSDSISGGAFDCVDRSAESPSIFTWGVTGDGPLTTADVFIIRFFLFEEVAPTRYGWGVLTA